MISSLILATVLLAQPCAGCGGNDSCGGAGNYYGGAGNYYGGYMVAQGPQLVWQVTNVPGGERTRSYAKANVGGKMYTIPVINGRLPVITHMVSTYEDRLVLDYGQDYPYTAAYRCGINYNNNSAAAVAHKNGPSAVKSYENQKSIAKKVEKKKSGPSGLKTPDVLSKKTTVAPENDALPNPTKTPSRPSDKEVDDLLK